MYVRRQLILPRYFQKFCTVEDCFSLEWCDPFLERQKQVNSFYRLIALSFSSAFRTTSDEIILVVAGMTLADILAKK